MTPTRRCASISATRGLLKTYRVPASMVCSKTMPGAKYMNGATCEIWELASIELVGDRVSGRSCTTRTAPPCDGPFTYERNGPARRRQQDHRRRRGARANWSYFKKCALARADADGQGREARREDRRPRRRAAAPPSVLETVNGPTRTYDYEYWPDGELKSVKEGATVLEPTLTTPTATAATDLHGRRPDDRHARRRRAGLL